MTDRQFHLTWIRMMIEDARDARLQGDMRRCHHKLTLAMWHHAELRRRA